MAGCSALEIGANHPGSNRPVLPLKKGTYAQHGYQVSIHRTAGQKLEPGPHRHPHLIQQPSTSQKTAQFLPHFCLMKRVRQTEHRALLGPSGKTAPASKCKTGQKQGKNRATFLGRKQYGEWFFAKRTHLGVERRCPHRHGPIRHSTVWAPRPWPAKLHSFCLTFAS